ncbi:hypothetical protein D3C87_1992940 [compost metagenome]
MGGAQQVEAAPRAGRGQPGGGIVDARVVRLPPLQERVLHGILGVGPRAEDAIGKAQQPWSGHFEGRGDRLLAHVSASRLECGSTR